MHTFTDATYDGWGNSGALLWAFVTAIMTAGSGGRGMMQIGAVVSLIICILMLVYLDTTRSTCDNGVLKPSSTSLPYKIAVGTGATIAAGMLITGIVGCVILLK